MREYIYSSVYNLIYLNKLKQLMNAFEFIIILYIFLIYTFYQQLYLQY